MCGIFSLINSSENNTENDIHKHISKNKKRGPEVEKCLCVNNNIFLAFHRLAINGIDESGDQPLLLNNNVIIGNGEIFNYKELIQEHNLTPKSNSDIEVLLHLYEKYDIDFLNYITGEYSFILYDDNKKKIIICRDQFGIRPLYYNFSNNNNMFCFSSTLSSIVDMNHFDNSQIQQFPPGCYMVLKEEFGYFIYEKIEKYIHLHNTVHYKNNVNTNLYNCLKDAVRKRVLTSERPVGALLSGGLDSSLICALSQEILKEHGKESLHTFSIGLKNSEDLKHAALVAGHIGSNHHEIIMTEKEFLDAIPNVIYDIESYDTTSVRASTGNWLIGKYIKENTDIKVILNGDGADELMGGYLYFHKAPNDYMFDYECRRLLNDIHMYDVLRSDRSMASHGIEPRTPMLDKDFVKMYLSVCLSERNHNNNIEKYLLRSVVFNENSLLLPNNVLWRQKEAFSDGVSSSVKSWFEIIQDDINERVETNEEIKNELKELKYPNHLNCDSNEKKYYYMIFNKFFNNCEHLIPYYWMPKFVHATDCSARTLNEIYNA